MTIDPYTAEARLCDDTGMVSDEPVPLNRQPADLASSELTYRKLLNNLRGHTGLSPYTGAPFQCTGSAHLAREHFRCTNPIHAAWQPARPTDTPGQLVPGEADVPASIDGR